MLHYVVFELSFLPAGSVTLEGAVGGAADIAATLDDDAEVSLPSVLPFFLSSCDITCAFTVTSLSSVPDFPSFTVSSTF